MEAGISPRKGQSCGHKERVFSRAQHECMSLPDSQAWLLTASSPLYDGLPNHLFTGFCLMSMLVQFDSLHPHVNAWTDQCMYVHVKLSA